MVNRDKLDKNLIRKVKSGDRKAFDRLCFELYGGLISYVRVFLSDDWAEDVVQDVLFSIWQNRERLDENSSVDNYIFCSVRNAAFNYIKQQQHSQDFREWYNYRIAHLAFSASGTENDSPLNRLYEGDLRKEINKAIDALPERQRDIFRLSYVEDLSIKEIAERLGISTRTVESHLYEALKRLRVALSAETMALFLLADASSSFFSGIF